MSLSYLIYIFGIILALRVKNIAGLCTPCGEDCCEDDEVCRDYNGESCYKKSDRITCSSLYHCYRPTTCCAYGVCCPSGYSCKGLYCIIDDTGGSPYTYVYVGVVCGSITLLAVILSISIRVMRARRLRQGVATGGVVNTAYSVEPMGLQPPPYTVATTSTSRQYGGQYLT